MAKRKGKEGAVVLEPGSDPQILYKNYVKECSAAGIEPFGQLKNALLNEENPNRGKQIILSQSPTEGGLTLGPDGCRALMNAMIGRVPFTAVQDIRICSKIEDGGAAAVGALLSATAKKKFVDPNDRAAGVENWKIEYLELINNEIGCVGALALGRSLCVGMNRTLTTLVLDFNKTLGSDGVEALCKGLKTNSTLKKLSLRYCGMDKRGGKAIADVLRFKKTALVFLDLSNNQLGGLGLFDMCDGLSENTSLKTLRLAENSIGQTDDDAKALEKFAGVLVRHVSIIAVDLLYNHIGTHGGSLLLPAVTDNTGIIEFKVDPRMDNALFQSLFRVSMSSEKKAVGKKVKPK
ncbi:hypothetical protein ACHAXH_003179 [Discostella pseudostelligera]